MLRDPPAPRSSISQLPESRGCFLSTTSARREAGVFHPKETIPGSSCGDFKKLFRPSRTALIGIFFVSHPAESCWGGSHCSRLPLDLRGKEWFSSRVSRSTEPALFPRRVHSTDFSDTQHTVTSRLQQD